jgi:hypothetical protein
MRSGVSTHLLPNPHLILVPLITAHETLQRPRFVRNMDFHTLETCEASVSMIQTRRASPSCLAGLQFEHRDRQNGKVSSSAGHPLCAP